MILLFLNDELTFSAMELQSELLTCPCLLRQPLLQLLLLLQELVYLLVVAEGLAHQLRLGHLGMFKLRGGRERERENEVVSSRHRCGGSSGSLLITTESVFLQICKKGVIGLISQGQQTFIFQAPWNFIVNRLHNCHMLQ